MTTGIFIGILIGIFIPAPYDAIVRNALRNLWNGIKSLFKKDEQ